MTELAHTRYEVGDYVYEPAANELRGPRRRIHLRPQTAALLNVLIHAEGVVVSRQQIRDALWPANTVLEFDLAIAACVKQLRRAFKDDASAPTYVETIHKRGYRLIADLSPCIDMDVQTGDSPSVDKGRVARRWGLSVAVAVAVALSALWLIGVREQADQRVMIFVASMESLTGQQTTAQASALFRESLIDSLSRFVPQHVSVISRTTSQAADVRNLTAGQIGQRFDADFLVEGSIRRLGDEVSLSIRLIGTADQAVVWGELIALGGDDHQQIESAVGYVSEAIVTTVVPEVLPPITPLTVIRLDGSVPPVED